MPSGFSEIIQSFKELASGLAMEVHCGDLKQPNLFVDIYKQPADCVAHIVYYGEGVTKGFKLHIVYWLSGGSYDNTEFK